MKNIELIYIEGANATQVTDSAVFADLMDQMEAEDAAEREEHPTDFDPIALVLDWADKDGVRIANGGTTWSETQASRNLMRSNNDDPESPWFGCAAKCWKAYVERLIQVVHEHNPRRPMPADLLSW